MTGSNFFEAMFVSSPTVPTKVSSRALRAAIEEALLADLTALLAAYDRGGGVGTPAKNLIFAANGPKPELDLRDAVNNDIEIVRNGEYCLIHDQSIPADSLTFHHLIDWQNRSGNDV